MRTCPTCRCHVAVAHTSLLDCVTELRKRLDRDDPTYSLHNRRLRFIRHPDADIGQYVLVAGFGVGETLFTQAKHELAICFDEAKRQELIALLQGEPEGTS